MNKISINVEKRNKIGTSSSRLIRSKNLVPAVLYGKNRPNISFSVDYAFLEKRYSQISTYSVPIELNIDNDKHHVLLKNIQTHPITDKIIHADFIFLGNKTQRVEIPLIYKNINSLPGVKKGGYFNLIKRSILIECPVSAIVSSIDIDLLKFTGLRVIKLKDIECPPNANFITPLETVIASILTKKDNLEEETPSDPVSDEQVSVDENQKPAPKK